MNKNIVPILAILALFIISAFFIFKNAKKAKKPIKKSNELSVGTNAEFPPFTYVQNNDIIGFDIDIIKEVAKRLNKKLILRDMPFDALIPDIQLGNIHIIAAGVTPTSERAKRVLFTKPYLTGDPLIIITRAENRNIKTAQDLIDKEVAVNEGYTADFYMSDIPNIELIRLPSPAEGFLALESGRAFAFVTQKSSAQPFLKKYGDNAFNIIPIKDTAESVSLAISKKYPKLLPHVQKTLDAMRKDGTINKLKKKWDL